MKNVIMPGVKISDELKKGGGTLWSLSDGDYELTILASREPFKGDKKAVVTSMGITTIASLFAQATQACKDKHTSASGEFQFNPTWKLKATLQKGEVRKLASIAAVAPPPVEEETEE
jgi:hypothetical protein